MAPWKQCSKTTIKEFKIGICYQKVEKTKYYKNQTQDLTVLQIILSDGENVEAALFIWIQLLSNQDNAFCPNTLAATAKYISDYILLSTNNNNKTTRHKENNININITEKENVKISDVNIYKHLSEEKKMIAAVIAAEFLKRFWQWAHYW